MNFLVENSLHKIQVFIEFTMSLSSMNKVTLTEENFEFLASILKFKQMTEILMQFVELLG